jgi:hypothetical protein
MLPFLSMALYTYRYAMAECGQVYILARVLSERGVYVDVYEKMERVTVAEAAARLGV